jgi:RecG-like helicase
MKKFFKNGKIFQHKNFYVKTLIDNIGLVKGIGEKRQEALNESGIIKIEDLLCYYPSSYQFRNEIIKMKDALLNDEKNISIIARIVEVKSIYTKSKTSFGQVKIVSVDEEEYFEITLFFFQGINKIWYDTKI